MERPVQSFREARGEQTRAFAYSPAESLQVGMRMNFFIYFKIMFFIHLNQSWSIQTNIFETNIINLAVIFLFFSKLFVNLKFYIKNDVSQILSSRKAG